MDAIDEQFIVGPENYLLRRFLDWTESQPPPFNPLVLHGPTGTGKSHLLHGLISYRRGRQGESPDLLVTGADLARSFARAVELDSLAEWQTRYREADLLAIDNLSELAGKTAVQQELIATLDARVDRQRLVLVTSRESPWDWNWLLPALRSRLEGGLTIPLALPSPVTQEFLLRRWLPDQALAGSVLPSDQRQALVTISWLKQAIRRQQWAATQTESLATPSEQPTGTPSISAIVRLVARHFRLRSADLLGPSRRQTTVHARGVAIYLTRTLLDLSFEEIGRHFGRRDHSTVLHAYHKVAEALAANAALQGEVRHLQHQLLHCTG